MLDPVARFRRFARAVTTEVGALDSSFLGRGRPLGAARVLNAVGQGRSDLAEVRAFLRLDSGLMSRLLRGLEEEGLIVTTSSPDDARRRTVSLTIAGEREYLAYEGISNQRAKALLDKHGRQDALLAALDLVASALTIDQIEYRVLDPRDEVSRYCLQRYYEELAESFEGGFDVKLSRDPKPEQMAPPQGTFLVAISDDLPIGCVGLKGIGNNEAEIKRLWVSPAARGLGLAYHLMEEAEAMARKLSITTLRLDTNRALAGALHLYRRLGWTQIERFNDDPYADLFFEKLLSAGRPAPYGTVTTPPRKRPSADGLAGLPKDYTPAAA
jgi:ribosomal protein S18 acetylase RimI-like enzyme/DNA-binding MarR family transcriptional regulator